MPEAENVTVAVRVRPFNKRELSRNAFNVISMDGKVTTIQNPKNPDDCRKFTFDYSYWSFDGYMENDEGIVLPDSKSKNGTKFADQSKVFSDLGETMLKNAFEGYNSTLFAYGQTGSGKSWSVIGFTPNDGIVPLFCAKLFKQIEEKKASGDPTEYEVEFSMLEIYNEVVRDLCHPNMDPKKGLKVRENPNKGFYADGLKSVPVANYEMISKKMEAGKLNRTIHATNMNNNSSRAHTIVGITFRQKHRNAQGMEMEKSAIINLVDLAGSERVSKTGASGDTLKEGAAINQSLSTLGNCIHALAEGGKTKVPYRDSVLTKLLMNALGGNSKTIMIAAISPADINYEESLTTLRYADRAKQIKTVATVNEDPTEKKIRELTEENERLKKLLESGKMEVPVGGLGDGDANELRQKYDEDLKAAVLLNEKKMEEMRLSYEEKLKKSSGNDKKELALVDQLEHEKQTKPHLYNLNIDAQLTYKIVHIINVGTATIGNKKGKPSDIVLAGPSMQEEHAIITCTGDGEVYLEPATPDAKILHNGDSLTRKIALNHNDRILFGATQLYVFCSPQQRDQGDQNHQDITYAMAQEEIAAKNGVLIGNSAQSLDNAVMQEDLLDVMPAVQEANSISSDLDKRVKFEIFLKPSQMLGENANKSEVCVKMRNLETGQEFVWLKEKFMNRLYLMKEMYSNYEDDNGPWELPEDEDPFQESPDTEVHIGCCQVFLQPLAFLVELKEQFDITDYKGNEVGLLNMEIIPCNENGVEYTEQDDMFADSPNELLGRDVFYILKIHSARGISNRYTDICCKYKFFLDKDDTVTKVISDTANPKFGHVRKIAFQPATQEVIHYLTDSFVMVNVWGKQKPRKSAMLFSRGKSTRELLRNDHDIMVRSNIIGSFNINGRIVDPQKQSVIVELLLLKKQQARLQQKVDCVRRLVEKAYKFGRKTVPTVVIREVLNASNSQNAEKAMAQLEVHNDDDYEEGDDDDDECCHTQKSSASSSFCTVL